MWIFSGVFLSRWRRSVTPTWWWRGFPTRPPFMRTTSATWPWTCWAPSTTSKTLPPEITSRSESVSRTTVSRDRAHRLFRLLLAVGRPRAQGRPPATASELAGILVPWSLFLRLLQAGLFIHSTTTYTKIWSWDFVAQEKYICSTTEPLKKGHRSRHWFLLVTRGHCFNLNIKTQALPNNSLYSQLCFRFSELLQLRTRDRQQELRGTNCDSIFWI